jgi:hypothetical protein
MALKPWAYTCALLLLLAAVALLASRGVIQSVVRDGDVRLVSAYDEYILGETIALHGTLAFADREVAVIERLRFAVEGPRSFEVDVPVQAGSHELPGPPGVGALTAAVVFDQVSIVSGPAGESAFKGVGDAATIGIAIEWTPPQTAEIPGSYAARLVAELQDGVANSSNEADLRVVPNVCGDQNGDGIVSISDAIAALQAVVGLISPSRTQLILGDLDDDGEIGVADVVAVLGHIVGIGLRPENCGLSL